MNGRIEFLLRAMPGQHIAEAAEEAIQMLEPFDNRPFVLLFNGTALEVTKESTATTLVAEYLRLRG